jgi:hypothetical protein
MQMLITAWSTYLTAVGMIYAVGEKAAVFLSPEALRGISNSEDFPISRLLDTVAYVVPRIVDDLLKFKQEDKLLVPNFLRSFLLSIIMLFLLFYPLRGFAILVTPFGTLDEIYLLLTPQYLEFPIFNIVVNLILGFIGTNLVSDYLSFVKTRALLDRFHHVKFRVICIAVSDITLSLLICTLTAFAVPFVASGIIATVTLTLSAIEDFQLVLFVGVWLVIVAFSGLLLKRTRSLILTIIIICILSILMPLWALLIFWSFDQRPEGPPADLLFQLFSVGCLLTAIIITVSLLKRKIPLPIVFMIDVSAIIISLVTLTLIMSFWVLWEMMTFLGIASPAQFIFCLFTSLGIGVISILATVLELIRQFIRKFESYGIWRFLNLREKPSQSAAVIVIILFTLTYWPIVTFSEIVRS